MALDRMLRIHGGLTGTCRTDVTLFRRVVGFPSLAKAPGTERAGSCGERHRVPGTRLALSPSRR
jgi:hypothetical protein